MFPPKLSKEQKEHHRLAHRSNAIVGNTWNLFMMYLQLNQPPKLALENAKNAMEVWQPFEDESCIEYPDVESPDMREEFSSIMQTAAVGITEQIRKAKEDANVNAMLNSGDFEKLNINGE